jgi:predicted RecA/RadA family phage recombinase
MATNFIQDGKKMFLAVTTGYDSGDPEVIGNLHGVLLTDADSDDNAAVDLGPAVYDLSVNAIDAGGNSAVAIGDKLYFTRADTIKLSKKNTGTFFGIALEAITSGSDDTINVLVTKSPPGWPVANSNDTKIYVDPINGDDTVGLGTIYQPVKSLTAAFALVTTTRKIVLLKSGTYDEADSVVWPDVNGVEVECPDGVATITSSDSVTNVISIDPAAAAGTWSATLKNINIDHGDLVGLQVDNANVGKRINLYLKNFSTEADSGASIDVNRSGGAGDAIRIYADGCGDLIEGLVTVITENTDDRFRFKGYRLIGGLTVVGAVACEVTLINSGVLTSGLTVDGANKLTNVGCWYETDANPNVYTNFANAFATY